MIFSTNALVLGFGGLILGKAFTIMLILLFQLFPLPHHIEDIQDFAVTTRQNLDPRLC